MSETTTRLRLPNHIVPYAFTFLWDNQKVWALTIPTEMMSVAELEWHLDIPWLHTPGGRFDVTPSDIMRYPDQYRVQYDRTMASDLTYPIDVMFNVATNRWQILDGLHRLMKSMALGIDTVTVRKVTDEMIPLIQK